MEGMLSDQQSAGEARRSVEVELGERSSAANILDKAVLQMLQDAKECGGGLAMLEKPLFDRTRKISRPDVEHSVILGLMYSKS